MYRIQLVHTANTDNRQDCLVLSVSTVWTSYKGTFEFFFTCTVLSIYTGWSKRKWHLLYVIYFKQFLGNCLLQLQHLVTSFAFALRAYAQGRLTPPPLWMGDQPPPHLTWWSTIHIVWAEHGGMILLFGPAWFGYYIMWLSESPQYWAMCCLYRPINIQ